MQPPSAPWTTRPPRIVSYDDKPDREESDLDRIAAWFAGAFVAQGARLRAWRLQPILRHTRAHEARFAAMPRDELAQAARAMRAPLRSAAHDGQLPVHLAGEVFALVREASERVLGMRHYDVQVLGAWAMMRGEIAEMRTGEGKTLCATLAVAATALSGRQVHLLTVNDYLADRDAREMGPLYDFLGLSRATVVKDQDAALRQAAYKCDIVYGTNTEVAFDYLRDRAILRRSPGNLQRKVDRITRTANKDALRLQGLPVAIIDEADSVLIDEARTPLIISGSAVQDGNIDPEVFRQAMDAALGMERETDYDLPKGQKRVEIKDAGFARLDALAEATDTSFNVPVIREHCVLQALNALHIFHRGDAYIVKDGKIEIVDENTGRTMPDRTWSDGLHQMVELKEGLEMTLTHETLSRMTFQRFFRRYAQVGGMTGTARDAAWELYAVYRLPVTRIPTNKPDIRQFRPDRVFATAQDKWASVADRVQALSAAGQPVLIGTRSINASDTASEVLTARGIAHEVLSADQDADEAALVARAGLAGRVTVATNMAGRGTDIKLEPAARAAGGLAVILSERHDSRRVDEQLAGRCGRQGDPGTVQAFLSLEDDLMQGRSARGYLRAARVLARTLGPNTARLCLRLRQGAVERLHAQARRDLMKQDREMGNAMAFSGEME